MSGKRLHIVIGLLMAIAMSSCSINKFIPEGKSLVKSNKVVIEGEKTEISTSELSTYITLKPYKSTLQTKVPNWVYFKTQRKPNSKFWKWLNEKFGREPVYYDRAEANNSAKQIMRYLDNVGYFHSKVSHTVKEKGKRAKVTYNVYPTQPYRINKIDYIFEDSLVERYIMRDKEKFPLAEGDIYNAYALDDLREMMTERLRNSGYYYFNRDYIYYEVDSNYLNHTLAITMKMKKSDVAYKSYRIRDISVYPNFSVFKMNEKPSDSASLVIEFGRRRKISNTLDFYYYGKPPVKPQTFSHSIHIVEGMPYNLRSVTSTYNSLNNFRLFSNVNIEFDSVPNDSLNLLDCRITMQKNDVHSFTVQAEGTNSDGDLGIKGSFSYTNKNIFHGAETFQLSLKGGLEAQKVIGEENDGENKVFNTRELGVTASILFPKFLSPFVYNDIARDYQPTTMVSLGFNGQVRYYYSRYITTASFNYDWKNINRLGHTLTPVYLNSVKIANINSLFQAYLDSETSQRKKDQYTSHLLFGTRYSLTYSSQRFKQAGSFVYLRADVESSGNLLSLFNKTKLITENENHHELLGIRYAQYVRTSLDFRQHLFLSEESWLVFREFVGIGVPYGNSKDLPFERSFYGGGSNGLRGWLYRTVGPGGYVPTDNDKLEKTGDIQLEMNAEYRFPVYNMFKGAIFVDAGNVWAFYPNESMPNAEFKFNSFYKQIALDAGIGIRLDVSFLILRIDLAYAMRNPYPDENGLYWRWNKDNNLRLQLGIGYPF